MSTRLVNFLTHPTQTDKFDRTDRLLTHSFTFKACINLIEALAKIATTSEVICNLVMTLCDLVQFNKNLSTIKIYNVWL